MASGRRITTVTLDWGDTLAANHGMPYQVTQRRAFERLGQDLAALGCEVDPATFARQAMDDLIGDWRRSIDPVQNPEHKEFDFAAMLHGWVAAVGGLECDPHRVQQAIARCTARLTDTVIPYGDSAQALSMVKARGYRIGILSHTPWPGDACREWFRRHGLGGYIDFYSLSCEVGWIKPHPRHFQHALDQARTSATIRCVTSKAPGHMVCAPACASRRTSTRRTPCTAADRTPRSCTCASCSTCSIGSGDRHGRVRPQDRLIPNARPAVNGPWPSAPAATASAPRRSRSAPRPPLG
jgi:FMN phosphatase YigB (HAD superfamily)